MVNLLSTKFIDIFCGAHGVDTALDAAAVLQEKGAQNIALVFIGDGKMKPLLMDRAKKEQLRNCSFLILYLKRH